MESAKMIDQKAALRALNDAIKRDGVASVAAALDVTKPYIYMMKNKQRKVGLRVAILLGLVSVVKSK